MGKKKTPLINNCFKVNRLTSQSKTQTGRIDLKKPSRKLPGSPGFCTFTAEGMGSIPGHRRKNSQAVWHNPRQQQQLYAVDKTQVEIEMKIKIFHANSNKKHTGVAINHTKQRF